MITVENVIRKHAKANGIQLTKEEKATFSQVEAATAAKTDNSGKLKAFLKLAGATALLGGVWWWFRHRNAGAGAVAITP